MKAGMMLIWPVIFLTGVRLMAQTGESEHFNIEKIGDGVFAAIHKTGGHAICNAGIVDMGDQTLVFDCFISPAAARDLREAAIRLTGKQPSWVINSHYHNDHIRGNGVFAGARIVAGPKTKALIQKEEPAGLEWEKNNVEQRLATQKEELEKETDPRKREEISLWIDYFEALKESHTDYTMTLPDFIMEDTLVIKGANRSVMLFAKGNGHTEEDIVMWLPEEKIIFAGDLLFVERHPWMGDGFVNEWMAYLETLKLLNPVIIVPGHGPVAQVRQLDILVHYFQTILALVDDAVKRGVTKEEFLKTPVPAEFDPWYFKRFFIPNLSGLYDAAVAESEK